MKSKRKQGLSNPSVTRKNQEKRLQKIARQYDRLEEALSELEEMLPSFESREDLEAGNWQRPRKPK